MHLGLMMECDYREGGTQDEAFDEAFVTAENAENWGFDGVWLAEGHFAPPQSGRAIPSVVASRLAEIRDELDLSGVIVEPNVGGQISPDRLNNSIRLIGQEVAPRLEN